MMVGRWLFMLFPRKGPSAGMGLWSVTGDLAKFACQLPSGARSKHPLGHRLNSGAAKNIFLNQKSELPSYKLTWKFP
jgi:hypothetical protein